MTCPRCGRPLPDWLMRDSYSSSVCTYCNANLDVYCFPALYRKEIRLDPVQLQAIEGDACCYQHSEKRAATICSNCGRFLCLLCEVQLGQQTLCPECLQLQKVQQQQQNTLDLQRTKFDSIALMLATWPLLLFYFVVITAPLSLIMAIYAWNRPTSIVRRSRWRLYLTLILSSCEIVGITAFIVFAVTQFKKFH